MFTLAEICESMNYDKLFETYARAWRRLNPITMFEIILFAYMERKFSSRQIVKCCQTDIRFMWLLNGEPVPSVATVKRFLSEKLGDVIPSTSNINTRRQKDYMQTNDNHFPLYIFIELG